jgi:hypothetical protein
VDAVVLLPTLNEVEGLARTLSDLPLDRFDAPGLRVRALVIDGGSTDGTLEVARKWDIPVLRQSGRGKGGAVMEAVAWIERLGIPFVVVLDADATYPPDRILPALHLLRSGADLVIGVRRPVWGPPSDVKDLIHRIGNILLSFSASFLTGRPILDLCSGFWGVSTHRFMDLELDDSGFAIEAELVLKAVRRGLSIHQIPVEYRERVGQAKLRAVRDGGRILGTILRQARPGPLRLEDRPVRPLWGQDILSIGLVLGRSGAVLECTPAGALEARRIAHHLRPVLPTTRVRPGVDDPPEPVPAASASVRLTAERETHDLAVSPLTVSLPPIGGGAGQSPWATVSFRSDTGHLTIDLPADSPRASDRVAPSLWARVAGRPSSGTQRWAMSPALLVVTARLNFDRDYQQATLLSANGYRLIERARASPATVQRASIEGLSSHS